MAGHAVRVGIPIIEGYGFTNEPVWLGVSGIGAEARWAEETGFDSILAPEAGGHDPFFPLLIAAEHTTTIGLSTGVAVAFPRSPTVVAQMAWDLQRFSGGRFTLGLGTQVKGQNERRFCTPWPGPPGPRLRDYVQCVKALFKTFQDPQNPTYHAGEHYSFSMMAPMFNPGPIENPRIPVYLAAVNRYNAALAGALCEGVFPHPFCTPKYMRETLLPIVKAATAKAGRSLADIDIVGAPIIVTGHNREELDAEKKLLKRRVAFYASTRTYHTVLEAHGWKELGDRLHPMSLEGRWKEMADLIPDEVAEAFAVVGPVGEIADRLKERWGGIFTTLYLPTDYPRKTPEDRRLVRELIETLHSA